jgi:hypothetical protein
MRIPRDHGLNFWPLLGFFLILAPVLIWLAIKLIWRK